MLTTRDALGNRIALRTATALPAGLLAIGAACGGGGSDTRDRVVGDLPSVLDTILTDDAIRDGDRSREFHAAAGSVTFEVQNDGTTTHELTIIRTDLSPTNLPVTDGSVVDEEAAGDFVARTSLIEVGDNQALETVLTPGKYSLTCNIPGQFEAGMLAVLIVQ